MGVFLLMFFCFLFIVMILFFLYFLFSLSSALSNNKLTSYECGFFSLGLDQVSFSIHFFSIMMVFVLFDLELVFLLGFLMMEYANLFVFLLIFFFVFLSYYYEIFLNTLVWTY